MSDQIVSTVERGERYVIRDNKRCKYFINKHARDGPQYIVSPRYFNSSTHCFFVCFLLSFFFFFLNSTLGSKANEKVL